MDEGLFRSAVACLDRQGIPYWVDGGTLLGLVRDGCVIPWDEDYDFGVMMPEVTESDIVAAFNPRDFVVRSLVPSRGVHTCHIFARGGRSLGKVDITFYERVGDRAVHVTNAAPERPWSHVLAALDHFLDPESRPEHPGRRQLHRWCHEGVAPRLPAAARRHLQRAFDGVIRHNCAAGKRVLYDFPASLLESRASTRFLGVEVSVPLRATDYLAEAYGPDWRTPRRFEHWYDGASRVEER